jgi:hypothetical protein
LQRRSSTIVIEPVGSWVAFAPRAVAELRVEIDVRVRKPPVTARGTRIVARRLRRLRRRRRHGCGCSACWLAGSVAHERDRGFGTAELRSRLAALRLSGQTATRRTARGSHKPEHECGAVLHSVMVRGRSRRWPAPRLALASPIGQAERMMRALLPCPSCARHVATHEARCPFCGAPLALAAPMQVSVPERLGRVAWFTFRASLVSGAVLGAGCSSNSQGVYGAPGWDARFPPQDAGSDGPQIAVDAGAPDATSGDAEDRGDMDAGTDADALDADAHLANDADAD